MSTPASINIPTPSGDVPLTVDQRGSGRPVVILHGGAGPASVTGFADLLADATGTRVITPTHPGFGGTPRPEALTTIGGLAEVYAGLLDALELNDATVIGNSIGGWITAELALRHPARLGRIALVNAVGVEIAGHPVAGALPPSQLAEYSWYDPSKAPSLDPATLPPSALEVLAGNRAALTLYGGPMTDAGLLARLIGIDVPALVLWGEADRIADTDYGRAFAAAIPGARFELLPRTGHVPQLETPHLLVEALRAFVTG
ncbi:alpha/beta fold hydrolase [Streptomyces sp. NBC_01089]|uniref:alpha/beta fold hydrolase n=1 Tax=Streptomyces sp. NBC_01089 TaxID=2903747 RepID=UPI003870CCB4|nr:alpha/beta hydrolase [Streptomyces sp. NBC_01089]